MARYKFYIVYCIVLYLLCVTVACHWTFWWRLKAYLFSQEHHWTPLWRYC